MTVAAFLWLVESYACFAVLRLPQLVVWRLAPTRIKPLKSALLLSRQILLIAGTADTRVSVWEHTVLEPALPVQNTRQAYC